MKNITKKTGKEGNTSHDISMHHRQEHSALKSSKPHTEKHPSPHHHNPKEHPLKHPSMHLKSVFSALKPSKSKPSLASHESKQHHAHDDTSPEQPDLEYYSPEEKKPENNSPESHDSKQDPNSEQSVQIDSILEEQTAPDDISDQPVEKRLVLEGSTSSFENKQLENNRKAMALFRGAKRYLCLNELILAQENIDEALSIETMDDDNYNRADAYFLATQICRRAKEYAMALDYIEDGIKSVNPYRGDGPKFVLAKGVVLLQIAEIEQSASKRKKYLDSAIESFKMAVSVSDVLLSSKAKYNFEAKEILTIKRYQKIAIFDLAYAHNIAGQRREAIASLDRLFELYPDFRVEKTPFELYNKILSEKKILHIAK